MAWMFEYQKKPSWINQASNPLCLLSDWVALGLLLGKIQLDKFVRQPKLYPPPRQPALQSSLLVLYLTKLFTKKFSNRTSL